MVIETWDSQAEHDKWFADNVKPQLPDGVPMPEFFEVIRTVTATHA